MEEEDEIIRSLKENKDENKKQDKEPMTRGHWILKTIDWTLLTILILVVIYAQIKGKYIDKQIINTCIDQGQAMVNNTWPIIT